MRTTTRQALAVLAAAGLFAVAGSANAAKKTTVKNSVKKKVTTEQIVKKLTAVQISIVQVPAKGMIIVDNIAFEK